MMEVLVTIKMMTYNKKRMGKRTKNKLDWNKKLVR